MKKLFFAGAVALALMTSCQNSESSMSNPEDQNHQTFKSAARTASSQQDFEDAVKASESELNGTSETSGRMRILCHVMYPRPNWGHACVQSGSGQIYGVDWNDGSFPLPKYDEPYYTVIGPRHYVVYPQDECSCR